MPTRLDRFPELDAAVARPISKSRAQYWQGRAYERWETLPKRWPLPAGRAYPETFYGQIALARIDATPSCIWRYAGGSGRAAELDADALMPQMKILADWARPPACACSSTATCETYPAPRHIKRLMLLSERLGLSRDRGAAGQGPELDRRRSAGFTHPVISLPAYPGPAARPIRAGAGLIRQETEFDAYRRLSAGARGLMQMMPASAKIAAKQAKLPTGPRPC
jgi:soluble lytic murein transglycosylase